MSSSPFSMITWGPLASPKRALVLHSSMGSALVWAKAAHYLVQDGYRVDSPDLLGHGFTEHVSTYSMAGFVEHLAHHLKNERYEVIAGISFGSTMILSLFPLLSTPPKRVVLVDPVIDWKGTYAPELVTKLAEGPKNPPTEEELIKNNLGWDITDAMIKRLAVSSFDSQAIYQMFTPEFQAQCTHASIPPQSSTEIIILAADPAVKSVYDCTVNAGLLEREYPHVKLAMQPGASHDMHKDQPQVITNVMQRGLDVEGLKIIRG